MYDGANSVEEVDQNAAVLARYTQSAGIDEPLAEVRSGTTSYYDQDGLGSVTSLSSSTGSLVNTYVYDIFGNLTTSSGGVTNPFQYTGRDYDPETGLRYYRARYYSPDTGRFLSEDPSAFDGGMNFYAYVGNDPLNWFDPFGLSPLGYTDIANLVAKNNKSGQSNELIICMAFKESSFDPDAMQTAPNTARGLLGVTVLATDQVDADYDTLGDPAANIAAGSTYLAWRIHLNPGNVRNGLWGYGTGRAYADSLLKCEKCLIGHAKDTVECKTRDCLEPLHAAPKRKSNLIQGRNRAIQGSRNHEATNLDNRKALRCSGISCAIHGSCPGICSRCRVGYFLLHTKGSGCNAVARCGQEGTSVLRSTVCKGRQRANEGADNFTARGIQPHKDL